MIELTFAVLFVIIMSAICSGSEAAIFSLPLSKARQMAEKNGNGEVVCTIREQPTRPIGAIVIWNNIFNIVGTFVVAQLATTTLSATTQVWFPFLLTALVIVFSEIIPKTIGERFSNPIMIFIARPLWLISLLMTPFMWLIESLVYLMIGSREGPITSEREIRALAKIGHDEGVIDEDEKRMIIRVFEMDDHTAEDIMTPRTALSFVRYTDTLEISKIAVAQSEHSRLVVIGDTIDEIRGIILKSTVLKMIVDGVDPNTKIEKFLTPVKLVKDDTPADELLDYFKHSKVHLAIVVDEYGGVSGVVTLEDVLEVLTGEIMDETDMHENMQEVALDNGRRKLEKHIANRVHESSKMLTQS